MLPGWIKLSMKFYPENVTNGEDHRKKIMDAKLNNFNTPVDRQLHTQGAAFFTGQSKTKGGYWKRDNLSNATLAHYLNLSPTSMFHIKGMKQTKKRVKQLSFKDLTKKLIT